MLAPGRVGGGRPARRPAAARRLLHRRGGPAAADPEPRRVPRRPGGRVLFASDAGGVGLNLQHAANCVINLELPWNPAVLEQRIGRIYRLGQKQPIDVYNLVSESRDRVADRRPRRRQAGVLQGALRRAERRGPLRARRIVPRPDRAAGPRHRRRERRGQQRRGGRRLSRRARGRGGPRRRRRRGPERRPRRRRSSRHQPGRRASRSRGAHGRGAPLDARTDPGRAAGRRPARARRAARHGGRAGRPAAADGRTAGVTAALSRSTASVV